MSRSLLGSLMEGRHGLGKREQSAFGARHHGGHQARELGKGRKRRGRLVGTVGVHESHGHDAVVEVSKNGEPGVFFHGLLHVNDGLNDVSGFAGAVDINGVLDLDQGMRLEVELGHDACSVCRY
jgi:hypothetical protein